MRELVVSEAPAARVSAIVKGVVEELGGVVSQHTHQATRFDHLSVNDDAWSRSGYVGTYQRFQDKEVRIRVRLWAAWPRRLFLLFAIAGLVQAVLYFAVSFGGGGLSPNMWIFSAIITFLGLGIALLTYATSWAASVDAEEQMAADIARRASDDEGIPGKVFTLGEWSEHRRDVVESATAAVPDASRQPRLGRTRRERGVDESEEPARPDEKAGRRLGRLRRRKEQATAAEEEASARADAPVAEGRRRFALRRRRAEEPSGETPAEAPAEPSPESAADEPKKRRFSLRRRKGEEEKGEEGSEGEPS